MSKTRRKGQGDDGRRDDAEGNPSLRKRRKRRR